MNLTLTTGPGLAERLCLRTGDMLIRVGQWLRGHYAVQTPRRERLREDRWHTALQQFVTFGAPLNFSQRKCLAAGIVTRKGYDELMGILRAAGVIEVYGRSGATWGAEWDKRRALVLIRRHEVPGGLHCPTDYDPPAVLFPPTAVAQAARRNSTDHSRAVLAQQAAVFARDVERRGT